MMENGRQKNIQEMQAGRHTYNTRDRERHAARQTYSRENGRQSYIQKMEAGRGSYLTGDRKAGRHPHMQENDRQTSIHEKERQADIRT
jgi:hypothetical protein